MSSKKTSVTRVAKIKSPLIQLLKGQNGARPVGFEPNERLSPVRVSDRSVIGWCTSLVIGGTFP